MKRRWNIWKIQITSDRSGRESLVYAYLGLSPFHREAKTWLEDVLSSGQPVGLPWQTAGFFLRLITNPKVIGERVTSEDAAALLDQWIAQPNVRMLAPGEDHWPLLRQMVTVGQAHGPLITDAQLAALTLSTEAFFTRPTATSRGSRDCAGKTRWTVKLTSQK